MWDNFVKLGSLVADHYQTTALVLLGVFVKMLLNNFQAALNKMADAITSSAEKHVEALASTNDDQKAAMADGFKGLQQSFDRATEKSHEITMTLLNHVIHQQTKSFAPSTEETSPS